MSFSPDVLVTGSSGHLGHALMYALKSYGYTPLGIDILPETTTTTTRSSSSSSSHTIICDITKREDINKIFSQYPSIKHIIHTATLHKPHVCSHSKQDFIQTNILGTLHLLEAAISFIHNNNNNKNNDDNDHRIDSFLYISTTSTFGSVLRTKKGSPAIWIDENVVPVAKNIYGATKVAAEDICYLMHQEQRDRLPILVLRTSRFFPEKDDDEDMRMMMDDDNLKVCELSYRRVDIADVVQACVCGMKKAKSIGWGKYIISAPSPFKRDGDDINNDDGNNCGLLKQLDRDATTAIKYAIPTYESVFRSRNWKFLERIDRVYDSAKAVRELDWHPSYTFENVIDKLARGEEWRSELTFIVGKKGYHSEPTGVYTE
eukprot:TRINITY_DN5036_c0_g1_i1.p1 TRINITY_DN5036_c0_g1~~TRINITY_DN5036_c0_g1_i1.p1  ORF type:complete len:374 (-),score=81.64 TRINITY_DN5036_c0_g1_i1:85-1206(-)